MGSVTSAKGTITFVGKVNDQSLREFLPAWLSASTNSDEVTLDFGSVIRAYPQAMLPIVCMVDDAIARGVKTRLVLPKRTYLARLFENANWGHLMDPERFDQGSAPPGADQIATTRFRNGIEQKRVVDLAMEVILSSLSLQRDVMSALEWCLNEVTDNVLNHAEANSGGLVQLSTSAEQRKVMFVVADAGRGIPATMKEGHPEIRTDSRALEEAVKQGVTRSSDVGQGNGLAGTLRIATGSGGSFKLRSGLGELWVIKRPRQSNFEEICRNKPRNQDYVGTAVAVELGADTEFSLSEYLQTEGIGHIEWDFIDAHYTTDDGGQLLLQMKLEEEGFGTRDAGRSVRRKIVNLLSAEPSKSLLVDWSGVPLVSSSYADEAFGRLFVEMGPLAFSSRVRHTGVEPLVRSLVDRAIIQRSQQEWGSATR